MGRFAGSIAAALIAATILMSNAAEAGRPQTSPATQLPQSDNPPITASDAARAGTLPPAPYIDHSIKYVDPGMPTPEPIDSRATPTPTPTSTPTPLPQVHIEGV